MGAARGQGRRFRWPWRNREEIESEIEEEIAFHLDMRTDDLVRSGVPEAEARERALSEFGDVDGLRRSLRRMDESVERRRRWWAWLSDLRQDLKFAVRSLRRSPGFAAVAVATLALGIGASVAVFTVVNTVVLRPLPYEEAERLVQVSPGQSFNITLSEAVLEGSPSIEVGTGLAQFGLTLTGVGDAAQLDAQAVSADFFRTFGVHPLLGRPFLPEERDPAQSDVVILSHGLWQGRFGGDPRIVGQVVELDGAGHERRTVVGVMPPGFEPPLVSSERGVDVWVPLSLSLAPGQVFVTDSTWYVSAVVGRLAPGATVERAAREVRTAMARIAERVRADYGALISEDRIRTAGASGLLDSMVGDVRGTLWLLLAAVGLVLLLACANLTNLLLARGDVRRQELAVRAALGAGRGRLVRTLLAESALLAVLGGLAGCLLARGILGVLGVAEASGLPRTAGLGIDGRVLGFALAVSLVSMFGFGLLPALRASGGDLRESVGSGGRAGGRGAAGRRIGFVLIAGEVALAMMLVTGAVLLLNSLRELRSVHPGMDTSDVLALELAPPPARYGGGRAVDYYERVSEELAALPGVRSVGAIQLLPFSTSNWAFPYLVDGQAPPSDGPLPSANFRVVTPGYFDAVDVPLLAGRALDRNDRADAPAVGIVNRTLAEQLWPDEEAVGKTIRLFGSQPFRVVGVVDDVRQTGLDAPIEPEIYFPLAQWPIETMIVMLETEVEPASIAAASGIRAASSCGTLAGGLHGPVSSDPQGGARPHARAAPHGSNGSSSMRRA